jgi:hypothetical protein
LRRSPGYLFADVDEGDIDGLEEKFDEIVANIRDLYKQDELKEFRFCIAGHRYVNRRPSKCNTTLLTFNLSVFAVICYSLGGGLTQLLAYHLASSGKIKDVIPGGLITAISFASPQVGNKGYNEAFQELERKGLIRHLRVSNQGDVVPLGFFGFGYTQTGVHMHLKDGEEMEIGYRNPKGPLSQGFSFKTGDYHMLESYMERLESPKNDHIMASETVTTLYEKYAGDFTA